MTFEEGELVYSIDKQRLYIGNSEEKGGILVSNRNYVKNSVGDPPVVPTEATHGDIVYDKSDSKTYITKCDSLSCELILIADAGCCARLQNEIDDLYDRLRTLMPCATTTPPPTPPPVKLTWYIEPSHISVNLGETATFTASAIGGIGVINYKWNRKDGIPISVIDNQPTLTFTTQLSDEATYYCVANTSSETIISRDAVLTIGANSILAEDGTYVLSELQEFIDWEVSGLLAPTIITHPRSQVTTTLVPVTFSVVADGSAPLSYQWRLNGVDIVGETGTTYTITNPTKDLTGITCYVSNSIGNVESNPASLSVGIKPTIVTQPVSQSVNTGSSVTFTVVAAGTNPLSYQWSKDGVVINGATSSTYTINSVAESDFADYSCLVSNIYGNITTNNANLKKNSFFNVGDIIISVDTLNFSLETELVNRGWDKIAPVTVKVIVNKNIKVGSTTKRFYVTVGTRKNSITKKVAFSVEKLPDGSIVELINNGYIVGQGGHGGGGGDLDHRYNNIHYAYLDMNGGDGLELLYDVSITNNGIIGGGGGGGGGNASVSVGGGGAGYLTGKGGYFEWTNHSSNTGTWRLRADAGTLLKGGVSQMGIGGELSSPKGGSGGDLGKDGKPSGTSSYVPKVYPGGKAGLAIIGIANAKFVKRGQIEGNVK